MNFPRRDFLRTSMGALAGSLLGPLGLATAGCSSDSALGNLAQNTTAAGNFPNQRPNILLMLVDQMRLPPVGYAPNQGEAPGVKEILGFHQAISPNNPFVPFFPAMLRLRKNSVVARRHYIASAACSPSRTTFITGQYPSLHGVDQVDGALKTAEEVTFLDPNGVPTAGDWFQAAGYEASYFGKWHVSNVVAPYDLTPWGFGGFETSGPEPHGSDPDNLGTYRDPGFADIVVNFLQQKGQQAKEQKPWFAVASLVNPHDIATFPFPFFSSVTDPTAGLLQPQTLPPLGTLSHPDSSGLQVALNPSGFPQQCFALPSSMYENLSTKPECHLEAAWKIQLVLSSLYPLALQPAIPYPFQRQAAQSDAWGLAFGQFYVYLQYLVDLELRKILAAFDAAGLEKNTIIVFSSDHGEYAMAHGQMVQKWNTCYEEGVRVPFVVSSPLLNSSPDTPKEVQVPTSHIDLLPTLLGLCGISGAALHEVKNRITGHTQVRDLVGYDLTPLLLGDPSQAPSRPGVLFTTNDDLTTLPEGVANPSKQAQSDLYLNLVRAQVATGAPLQLGTIAEPNSVHMLCTGDWKLGRYLDTHAVQADQWELYHLPSDPTEVINLLDFRTGALRPGLSVPGYSPAALQAQVDLLKSQLSQQESKVLLTPI